MFCKECGNNVNEKAIICTKCGCSLQQKQVVKTVIGGKSRAIYIILALFFGFYGVHSFYAKNNRVGFKHIGLTLIVGLLLLNSEAYPTFGFLTLLALIGQYIWIFIEMFTVKSDADNIPFN